MSHLSSPVQIRASIDLGTNTCLLLVAEWDPVLKGVGRVLGDFAKVVRLGEGVDSSRMLQAVPMERALVCLKDYQEKVKSFGIDPASVVCVATSQARDAANSAGFFLKISKEIGFTFRVLSGDEEARATFMGALLPGMESQSASVIDIGGGSTEIISLQKKHSFDIGSVRFTERYLKTDSTTPVSDAQFWACQDAIDAELSKFLSIFNGEYRNKSIDGSVISPICAVAGTATTLAAWHLDLKEFDSKRVDSLVLTRGDIHRMVEELKWRTIDERKTLPCMEPLRADVILAGALILWRAMELFGFPSCQVSTRGLRYGVLPGVPGAIAQP